MIMGKIMSINNKIINNNIKHQDNNINKIHENAMHKFLEHARFTQ